MPGLGSNHLRIAKTIKLYIGGQFPRTESGHSFPINLYNTKKVYANACRASRKDIRMAVEAAKKALPSWSAKTAFNRSQILYRMAEMIEGKRYEFVEIIEHTLGYDTKKANAEVDAAIDAFVYYAGFADKLSQITATVNPVAGAYHNFTAPEAVGVVGLITDTNFNFGKLAAQISSVVCTGNTIVVLLNQNNTSLLSALAEVFNTSDLTDGAINLLSTDDLKQIYTYLCGHMEVDSISYSGTELMSEIQSLATENMKRVVQSKDIDLSLKPISDFVEYKTVWHPIGF